MKKTSKCNKAIFDRNQVYGFVPEAAHSIVLETRASSYGIKSKFLCASVQDNFNECAVKPQGVYEVPKRTSHSFTAWPNNNTLSYPTIGAPHNQNEQSHNVSRALRAVDSSNNKNHDDDFSHNVSFALPEDKYVMINGEMVEVIPHKALHEIPEDHTHLRSSHHDDDFSSDVSRTLTVEEVTGELDSIELCVRVLQEVSDKMCVKYNACDTFFDDSYGLTGTEESPDDYPYKDDYVISEIDSGQLVHERNDWELNIRCGHMYWEECNIIRRHGVNNLPVYVYELPDTQYDSSTNTIRLHGEIREWIKDSVTSITRDPKVRHRTWGNVKRRVKVTNTDSPHWLIAKYGYIHFDEWHLLDKLESGVFDSPYRLHAENAYFERGVNSTSGYVCLSTNCLQTFPRVSLDTSFFYCLAVVNAIIFVLSFVVGYAVLRLRRKLVDLWNRFDVWLLPFHPNSDVEDDELEPRYIPQRDCHLSDRAKVPHYRDEYRKRHMDDEDVDPLEDMLDARQSLIPPILFKWVSTLYDFTIFWIRYILSQYCSYRTRRIITCSINEVNKWRNSLFTIVSGNMSKDDKLRWIEIKSTLHLLYHAYNGNKAGAAEWLSNFIITRREWVSYVSSLPYDQIKKLFEEPTAEVVIDGRPVRVDSKTWDAILSRYEKDPLNPDYDSMDFEVKPNSGFMETAITWAWDQLDPGIKGLSANDIRDANYQFTFMKNRRSETERKLSIATNIISSWGRVLFGVDPFDPEYMSFISSMISIIEYSRQSLLRRQDLCTDRQFMTTTLLKADESMLIFNNPRINTAPRFLQTSYRKAHEDLQSMCSEALKELAGSEQRYEPTSVLLTGPPSVGKSAFTRAAMKALCRMDGLSYDNTMMFSRAADSDYWDGYNKQKFVVVDDLWKSSDMQKRGIQTEDVVSMINTARFSLNMAFGDKGKVTFDSEYVFFSTNLANRGIGAATLQIQATDNEAIKRRFHIVLHKDTKLEKGMNIMMQMWRVDASPYPEMMHENNPVYHNTVDVIKMIKRAREDSIKDALVNEISDDTIDELFQLNAGKDTSVDGTYSRLMVLGLYEWTSSPYSKYFVAMFAVITVCAIMAPVLRYMFPIDVNAHAYPGDEMQDDSAYVFENGKWVHWKKSSRQAEIEAQRNEREDYGLPGKKHRHTFTPNSCRENFEESLVKRVSKSMMYISAHALGSNGERMDYSSCVASHLMGGWILTCAHWYHTYRDYHERNILCELYIRIGEKVYNMPFPVGDDVKVVQEADVVCIKLPTTVPMLPQLMKDIMSCESLRQLRPGTAMTVYRVDRDGQCRFKTVTSVTQTSPISYSSPLFHIIVEEPIAYFDNSSSGESGSLLIAEGPNGKVVIVGMHVGNKPVLFGTKLSYATPLIRENLEEFLKEDQELQTNSAPPGFPLEITEHVDMGKAYYPSRVSRLKQSDVNGWDGPPVCIPAKLNEFTRNNVKYNPLYIALQKIRQTPFPSFVMPERIFDHVLCTYPRKVGSRLLTMSEAINGVSALHIPSIRLRTSPGYPYTLLRNKPGKFSFIESVDGVLVPTDVLKADVESMLLAYVNGKPPRILFADSLKDETRPIDKVYAGKTRVISSVPLPYLVLVRMYFGDFVSYVQSTPTTRPVCVGINVHSLDWNRLYNRMCSTSGSVFSCDFSNFDGSIPAFLNEVFAEFVNRWYNDSDENKRVRKGLLSATNNAYHIVYDMIYQASGGGPSGEPITSVANSFKVYFALSYVLIFHMGLKEGDFNAALYGDDTFGTTKQKGITWKHLVAPFKDLFGFTLTHCTKKDTDVVDTMDNVEFLSRKFVNGKYAPLPIKTITEMTYWRRGNTSKDVVLLSTVRSFYAELSHYPIEIFNKYCDKFLAHMQQNEDVSHLVALAADERKSWWYYDEWKYNPRPDQAPMVLYYGEEGWGNYVELGYEPDFQPNSGKPDPVRMGTHDTEPTSFAVNRDLAPIITQKDQLGGMMDVNPVTTEFLDPHMTQQVHTSINMEGYDLDGALNRLYLLPCPVWSSAMASDTLLVTYLFPDEIFVQNFIIEKITDFRYFTADILVRVSVKSTEFGYGTLIVGFVPNINDVSNVPNNIYGLAGGHHVLVRAGAAESVEMLIPFIYPRRYLDMENYIAGDLGRVTIKVLNPLRDIQGNPVTMDVIVTAQFVNAKLYFPDVTDGPTVSKILSYRNPYRKSDIRRTKYDPLPRTVHFADSDEQDTVSEMSAVVVEHIDNFQVNSGRGEARSKSRWNSASNSLISGESVRSVVRVGQLVAPFAGTLMSTVNYIGKRISGLSKPTTLALADVDKINPFSDLTIGKGIDTSLKLAMDPENAITTEPNVAGISHDEMDLLRVIMTPALAQLTTLNKGDAPVIVAENGPALNPLRWTYVDWVSNNFFFWSGSIKIKIYINAGYFHDVQLVFWLAGSYTSPDDWSECNHWLVEVKGPTEVEFTLPYTSYNVTAAVGSTNNKLYVYPLSWSEMYNTVDTPIDLNIYKAGASDYRVHCLLDQMFTVNCNPRADFEKDFPMFAVGSKGYTTSGFVHGEEYTTVREIIHRPMSAGAVSTNTINSWVPVSGAGTFSGISKWSLLYYFWRGSLRFKAVCYDSRQIAGVSLSIGSKAIVGNYYSSPTNPVIEFTVPYYSNHLYGSVGKPGQVVIGLSPPAMQKTWMYKSGGDDFSFLFLRLPPSGFFSNGGGDAFGAITAIGGYNQRVVFTTPLV